MTSPPREVQAAAAAASRRRHHNRAGRLDRPHKVAAAERLQGRVLGQQQAQEPGRASAWVQELLRRRAAGLLEQARAWAPAVNRPETQRPMRSAQLRHGRPNKPPTRLNRPKASDYPGESSAKDRPETSVGQVAEFRSLF